MVAEIVLSDTVIPEHCGGEGGGLRRGGREMVVVVVVVVLVVGLIDMVPKDIFLQDASPMHPCNAGVHLCFFIPVTT